MKIIPKIFIILILTSLTFNLYCQDIDSTKREWSLSRCIEYAKENNIQIKQQELVIEQSLNNITQSKLDFVPTLNSSLSHNMSWGRSVNLQDLQIIKNKLSQSTSLSLSSSIKLFDGFTKQNNLKSSQTQLEIDMQNVEKLKNEITIAITKNYLQVLLSYEIDMVAKESINSVLEQYERTKKMVEAGNQPYTALLEIQSQLATENVQLVTSKNNININLLSLAQLLDLSTINEFSVSRPNIDRLEANLNKESIDDIYSSAQSLPQIKSAELSLENSKIKHKIQKAAALPSLSLNAGYGTYYSDSGEEAFFTQFNNNRNPTIGFGISIPIFNNYRTNTAIKNSKIAVKSQELELKRSHQNLYKEIQQAYYEATAAFQKLEAAKENMQMYKESFKSTEQKFNLGLLNGTDYIVAKTNLFKAQSDYIQAKYQYIFQTKILDFYKGIPITL